MKLTDDERNKTKSNDVMGINPDNVENYWMTQESK